MLINTYLDTEDFVHLYYPEDEPPAAAAQGCGAGARMASKYQPRPPSPQQYTQVSLPSTSDMERERYRAPPPPEPPPHRVRAADLYPRLRTHYDEPGLDVGFTPICGEFVQWVGRIEDGGTIAMSNYRLHIQPRRRNSTGNSAPLRLIDAVEVRDLTHLVILCKHGRQIRCTFKNNDQSLEWSRRLNSVLVPLTSVQDTFAAAYAAWAKEQSSSSVHRALIRASQKPQRHWFGPEVERLDFTRRGAWRVSAVNADYRLCSSYPPLMIVPSTIGDEDLDSVARFRAMRRIPTVVWRHRGNGAVIARSSQPEVGWLGWRSAEDERLLAAFVTACNMDNGLQPHPAKNNKLLIVDARSYASAVTNRARGGGCECQQYYPAADIQFMSLPNIHHVRKSFHQLRALAADPSDQSNWHSNVERTLWLQYVSGVLRAASVVARAVGSARPVLVHCSDGWDRTPQIVASAQLLLDPYYRTLEGFRILIEREWLDFGHKFADRCGHQFAVEDVNERSPVFLQWLDLVYQLMLQYPCSFEFNEAYLIKLATHVHSCMFGTFLCNTSRERSEARVPEMTAHVWQLLLAPAYRNHLYPPLHNEQVLFPEYGVRSLQLWRAMFCGERQDGGDHETTEAPITDVKHPSPKGLMTKTRSCDNLLKENEVCERRTTQRRCSDPNLAPDVMKLSNMVSVEECSPRRVCRALTDSCVDELPAMHHDHADHGDHTDQVDGLHPDHFENSTSVSRDISSGSSSLERELAVTVKLSDNTDEISDNVSDKSGLAESVVDQLARTVNGNISGHIMDDSVVRVENSPEVDTPEEPAVFVCDSYGDVIGMAEAAREAGRMRNVSITWRSVSESSNQSSAFETADTSAQNRNENQHNSDHSHLNSHESSPLDNHNSTDGDVASHNVVSDSELTNHNTSVTNGDVNGIDETTTKFLEVDLNGGPSSSSISSESDGELHNAPRRTHNRARVASQLTLCPASPRRLACCHCTRRPSANGMETCESAASSELCWCGVCGGELGASRVRCTCGGGSSMGVVGPTTGPAGPLLTDPVDGLPPAIDPLQTRLHQIILHQKKVVEELSSKLREAREALQRASSAGSSPAPPDHHPADTPQACGSGSGSGASGRSSASSSASEVEVGEEARSVVWLPDSAVVRCQYCKNHFWLARRRHHCRRCGGIFCGSCAVVSAWGDFASMRVCRICRANR